MSDQVLRDALRMCAREVANRRLLDPPMFDPGEADELAVDDTVAEFIAKARGFPAESSRVSP